MIQVAKHLGAYVATTARTSDIDKVRTLGADEVIDFTTTDFADVVSGYDVVIDSLGPDSLRKSFTVLRRGGLTISVVGPPIRPSRRNWASHSLQAGLRVDECRSGAKAAQGCATRSSSYRQWVPS